VAPAAALAGLTPTGYTGEAALAAAHGTTVGDDSAALVPRSELARFQRNLFAACTAVVAACVRPCR
jgi:hypothetical protein